MWQIYLLYPHTCSCAYYLPHPQVSLPRSRVFRTDLPPSFLFSLPGDSKDAQSVSICPRQPSQALNAGLDELNAQCQCSNTMRTIQKTRTKTSQLIENTTRPPQSDRQHARSKADYSDWCDRQRAVKRCRSDAIFTYVSAQYCYNYGRWPHSGWILCINVHCRQHV